MRSMQSHPLAFVVIALGFIAALVGCGGQSTPDRFQQIAKARAAANRAAAAEAEKEAQQAPAPESQPAADETPEAQASQEPTAKEEDDNNAASKIQPDQEVNDQKKTKPAVRKRRDDDDDDDDDDRAQRPRPTVAQTSGLPRRDVLMAISKDAKSLAHVNNSNTIGIYDVASKKLVRQIYNPEMEPFALGISPSRNRLAVGGIDGSFKTFPIDSVNGLDRFKQKRVQRSDVQKPRRGHDHPITAIAIDDDAGIVVTGDSVGQIKFWSDTESESVDLMGPGSPWRSILSYQDNNIVFAANESSISYWSLDSADPEARDFDNARFDASPTVMTPGPNGKGLAVGDSSGGIHLWTLADGQLELSTLTAHQAPIMGIGFAANGESMTTISRTGQISSWALPLKSAQTIKLVERTEQFIVDDRSSLFGVPSGTKNLDVYSVKDGEGKRRHLVPRGELTTAEFISDNDLVALGSTSGDVFFQGTDSRTIASLTMPSPVEQFVHLGGNSATVGFRCRDGAIGVARSPKLSPRPMVTFRGSVWSVSKDRRQMLLAENDQLMVVDVDRGNITKQIDASSVMTDPNSRITAIHLAQNLLVAGTSDGKVYLGDLLSPSPMLKQQAGHVHTAPVVAIGITPTSQLWSCDSSGANLQSVPNLSDPQAPDSNEPSTKPASQFQVDMDGPAALIANGRLWRSASGNVFVHDAKGDIQSQWEVGDQSLSQLRASETGEKAAALTESGTLLVFSSSPEQEQTASPQQLKLPVGKEGSIVWSPNETKIAVLSGRRLIVVDVSAMKIESVQSQNVDGWQAASWASQGVVARKPSGQWIQIQPAGFGWINLDAGAAHLCAAGTGDQLLAASSKGACRRHAVEDGQVLGTANVNIETQSLVSLPGTGAAVLLDDRSGLHLIDDQNAVATLPITVPAGIEQIGADSSGRRLLAITRDGQILSWSADNFQKPAAAIPCDVRCIAFGSMGAGQLLVAGGDSDLVQVISTDSSFRAVRPASSSVTDAVATPDGNFVALANGSATIELVALSDGNSRPVQVQGTFLEKIAVSPDGSVLAALGDSAEAAAGGRLVTLDIVSGDIRSSVDLRSRGRDVSFSTDGSLIAVQLDDDTVSIHAAGSGDAIETIGPTPDLETVAISDDSSKLLLGRSGGIVSVVPLTSRGSTDSGTSAVVSLDFHRGAKYLLSASLDGTVKLWSRASLSAPQALFKGLEIPIAQSAVSVDGKYVAAAYEDTQNTIMVWDIDSVNSNRTMIDPKVVLKSDVPSTAVSFTSDSRYVLLGGTDGAIRAWSVSENREVARFTGHQGAVVQIASKRSPGQFVSSGRDKSIRSWRFPATLPGPGARIPNGSLSDSTNVQELAAIRVGQELLREDPTDAARQALISGAKTSDVVDLLDVSEDVKQNVKASIERVASLESGRRISATELSKQRRSLARSQERLRPSASGGSLSTFADGFSNLSFVGQSNFKFDTEEGFRPVQMLFADRFLYAARPSSGMPQQRRRDDDDDDDNARQEEDQGDNGALLSWDFKFSRLQAHAWSIEDINLQRLVTLPNSAGVCTVPQIVLFNQDGSSRPFRFAASWAKSLQLPPASQYLAVGSPGTVREEDDILSIFNVADFANEQVSPVSRYRSFEGVVTATAFANNAPYVAFCVRERAIHRLFIADIETLAVQELERFTHQTPWTSGTGGARTSIQSRRIPSINALAFAPDDSTLVAHSSLNSQGRRGGRGQTPYKLSRWNLRWENQQLVDVRKFPQELEGEMPFIFENDNQPIRFINRLVGATAGNGPTRSQKNNTTNAARLILRSPDGLGIVNYSTWRLERKIPFLETQRSTPLFSLSEDNSWLIMGDDSGAAFIYDLVNARQYRVTSNQQLEQQIADANLRVPTLDQRPAHTGPVVGVAIGEPDPGQDYPAFVATCGEENKIKVWEMFPILDPTSGLRSRNWGTEIKTVRRPKQRR